MDKKSVRRANDFLKVEINKKKDEGMTVREISKNWCGVCAVLFASMLPAFAESEGEQSTGTQTNAMISLTEQAPQLTPVSDYSGRFWERYALLGDLDGARQRLYDQGITLDASLTQVYQGVASGGLGDNGYQYASLLEYGFTLDSGKLGLWPGGLFVANISAPAVVAQSDYSETLTKLMGDLNICSRESKSRIYDGEVKGLSIVEELRWC